MIFVDPAEASPATGSGELRLHCASLRSLHVRIPYADEISSVFHALVASSSRLRSLRIGYDAKFLWNMEKNKPQRIRYLSREKNSMQHRNLHSYIPELVYLESLNVYKDTVRFFKADSLLQALQRNGSIHFISVVTGSTNQFWTSNQRRFISAFCESNRNLPKMLSKIYCRVGIADVSDDVGYALAPILFSAALPMRRMTPTFILMGLISMQEWNR